MRSTDLTTLPASAYQWDAEGRLTTITQGGSAYSTSAYNANGQMAETVYPAFGNAKIEALLDPFGRELGYYDGQMNAWFDRDFWVAGQMFAQSYPNEMYFLHHNALGSDVQLTGHSGTPTVDILYYPWGGENTHIGYESDSHFAGFEQTGGNLNPTPTRRYANPMGRWLTPDLLGGDITNPQSLNRYAYALNNPTTLTDPSGLDPCMIDGQAGICVTSTDVGPGDPMLEMIWEMDACLDPLSGCPYDYYQQNEGSSSNGGGSGAPVITSPPSGTVTLRNQYTLTAGQVMSLVAANNESNLCDAVVDCIIFKESSTNGGFYAHALGVPFTPRPPERGGPQQAKGLMQITQNTANTINGLYPMATSGAALYQGLFNPAINIMAGSDYLQYLYDRYGNLSTALSHYGPSGYANAILNCVQQLQRGNVSGAEAAALGSH